MIAWLFWPSVVLLVYALGCSLIARYWPRIGLAAASLGDMAPGLPPTGEKRRYLQDAIDSPEPYAVWYWFDKRLISRRDALLAGRQLDLGDPYFEKPEPREPPAYLLRMQYPKDGC